ncbi:hypothetical protein [Saccharopolyspora griseoalba]|uniref:Uncharacterized protein n=1 Tax=Saccharopolyspora griseoalba TaxID=1431848 RepID=A0ABW2LTA7_9PSEU
MNFNEALSKAAGKITTEEAQDVIRAQFGRGATRWVAQEAGISMRSAQRWMSGNPPASRTGRLRKLASDQLKVQAFGRRLQASTVVRVGEIRLRYGRTEDQGKRCPYNTKNGSEWFNVSGLESNGVLDALKAGDIEKAEELFSQAVLDAYGIEDTDTFDIGDFGENLELA